MNEPVPGVGGDSFSSSSGMLSSSFETTRSTRSCSSNSNTIVRRNDVSSSLERQRSSRRNSYRSALQRESSGMSIGGGGMMGGGIGIGIGTGTGTLTEMDHCSKTNDSEWRGGSALGDMVSETTENTVANQYGNGNNREVIPEEWMDVFKTENKKVMWLRQLVFTVLVLAAVLVSVGVYFYTKLDEKQEFEQNFEDFAQQVVGTFREAMDRRLGVINNMAVAITSFALDMEMKFPYVTVPDFVIRGSGLRVVAESQIVHWLPLITDTHRNKWEQYALQQRFQIDESYTMDKEFREKQDLEYGLFQREDDERQRQRQRQRQLQVQQQQDKNGSNIVKNNNNHNHNNNNSNNTKNNMIDKSVDPNVLQDGTGYHLRIWDATNNKTSIDGTGPFLPLWQRSPVNEYRQSSLNLNFASTEEFDGVLPVVLQNHKAVINKAVFPSVDGHCEYDKSNLRLSQYRHVADEYINDPLSFLGYPVYDTFGYDETDTTTTTTTTTNATTTSLQGELSSSSSSAPPPKIVGLLATNLNWKLFFTNVLRESGRGIICVLENSFNQTFAYRIDGSDVTFLGEGDPHDIKYDRLEVKADINVYVETRAGPENRAHTTVPLDIHYGRYTLRVYPSDQLAGEYLTNKPTIYTILVASVFIITSVVFLAFTYLVERRQKVVLSKALQSGAIVTSLYPRQVRHRLFDTTRTSSTRLAPKNGNTQDDDNSNNNIIDNNNLLLSNTSRTFNAGDRWNTGTQRVLGLESIDEAPEPTSNTPIADLYPETTVMFADLAGFTAWSSGRQPSEVFLLLETLYGAFDVAAEKLKVFKVETIGDCYVCATGIPDPQTDHAVIMTKFARRMIVTMGTMVDAMAESLGFGTKQLQMRIGMHSGAVTAGVLRGQKSRFQLFGDTVNTAARIEATGQAGKIHCSMETADELVAAGKRHWLIRRKKQNKDNNNNYHNHNNNNNNNNNNTHNHNNNNNNNSSNNHNDSNHNNNNNNHNDSNHNDSNHNDSNHNDSNSSGNASDNASDNGSDNASVTASSSITWTATSTATSTAYSTTEEMDTFWITSRKENSEQSSISSYCIESFKKELSSLNNPSSHHFHRSSYGD